MWIILLVPFVLLNSLPLFAHGNPQREHICQAARHAMARFEIQYIPKDTLSCLEDDDCSFLSRVPWRRAVGINKTALAGYQLMLRDPDYQRVFMRARSNCNERHPQIVFPLPIDSQCVNHVCTPIFSQDDVRN